jgi:membrane fusion protein, multidrug efflux system
MHRHHQLSAIPLVLCLLAGGCSGKPDNEGVATQTPAGGQGAAAGPAGGRGGRGGGRGGPSGPVPVTTALVQNASVPVTIPSVGTAEAQQTVQVRAQVTGQLSVVRFTEGQEVRKGQELFTIDARPFQAALSQAEAVLARDTATSNNAQAQRARSEDLYKRQLISRDQYESQMATASAAQATLEADRAAIETARLNLQYTHILAPLSGRTGAVGVHQGDLVRANDTNPMVVINQLSPIYVTFAVPGRYLPDIRKYQTQKPLAVRAAGQPALPPGAQPPPPPIIGSMSPAQGGGQQAAKAAASAGITPGLLENGRVSFIDNAVDTTTGTIKLKATFENTDHALWPGLFVQITLDLTTENNSIVVPAAAVQPSQAGQFVYVVKPDSSVEVRPVVILRQQGEQMVIASGLAPGEEVVIEGQLRLTPGARISRGGGRGNPEEPAAGQGGNGRGQGGGGRRGKRNGNPS